MKLARDDAQEGHVSWSGKDGTTLSYKQQSFTIIDLSEMMQKLVQSLKNLMDELVFAPYGCALPEIPDNIKDDLYDPTPGFSFIRNPENELWIEPGRRWLFEQICTVNQLQEYWINNADGDIEIQQSEASAYLARVEEFRKQLLVAVHLLAGQPARATELLVVRLINTPNGGLRNMYIRDNQVCIQTGYHKSYAITKQAKLISRFLPRELTPSFVRYLWMVLPFAQYLSAKLAGAPRCTATPWLWANSLVELPDDDEDGSVPLDSQNHEDAIVQPPRHQHFVYSKHVWSSDKMRRVLEAYTRRHLKCAVTIHGWRHIAIAIARRFIRDAQFVQQHELAVPSYEDSDTENDEDDYLDLQAAHSSHTAQITYGRTVADFGNVKSLMAYLEVSTAWHKLFGFGSGSSGIRTGHTSNLLATQSHVHVRRLRYLRTVDFEAILIRALGQPGARLKPHQAEVLSAIVLYHNPILQIVATGQGKTMSFLLPAMASPSGGITVVVVPFVVLQADLVTRINRIQEDLCTIWSPGVGHCTTRLVLVSPEYLDHPLWQSFIERLVTSFHLDRIVVDECHAVLDASYRFRPQLRNIRNHLLSTATQLVFLTATLQPRCEAELWSILGLYPLQSTAKVFRGSTNRPDIQYQVRTPDGSDREEDMVVQLVNSYLAGQGGPALRGRVIVYCCTVELVGRLAQRLGCLAYHASIGSGQQKDGILADWKRDGGAIVATNALGQGFDEPDIRLVVHAGLPRQLRHFVQETGRASRDGKGGTSVLVYAASALKAAKRSVDEEEIIGYAGQMAVCRRQYLASVMDGLVRQTCTEGESQCDLCSGYTNRATKVLEAAALDPYEERMADGLVMPVRNNATREAELQRMYDELRKLFAFFEHHCICSSSRTQRTKPGYKAHRFKNCTNSGQWSNWIRRLRGVNMERYSCCFRCRLPQELCEAWATESVDGGSFKPVRRPRCLEPDLLITVIAAVLTRTEDRSGSHDKFRLDTIRIVQRMGGSVDESCTIEQVVAKRVDWCGVEASGLSVLFWVIGSINRLYCEELDRKSVKRTAKGGKR